MLHDSVIEKEERNCLRESHGDPFVETPDLQGIRTKYNFRKLLAASYRQSSAHTFDHFRSGTQSLSENQADLVTRELGSHASAHTQCFKGSQGLIV